MENLKTWSELQLFAGLIYGEARGESWLGKLAVGQVVRNRVQRPGFWNWGENWREVILAPKQFSCFEDSNLEKIVLAKKRRKHDFTWQECWSIAELVYLDRIKDRFNGATHYCAKYLLEKGNTPPKWVKSEHIKYLGTIGKHSFYTVRTNSFII